MIPLALVQRTGQCAAPTGIKMTVLYYDHPANLEKTITADPKPVNGFRNAVRVAAVGEWIVGYIEGPESG